MWISLEPKYGLRVDVYPVVAQERIESAWSNGNQSVSLGTDCYNAVLTFSPNGKHVQRTPAFKQKPAGQRSVQRLSCANQLVYVARDPTRWHFADAGAHGSRIVSVPHDVPDELSWEWSMNNSMHAIREVDWVPYDVENSNALEVAWQKAERSGLTQTATLTLGASVRYVEVNAAMPLLVQRNDSGTRTRPVRRRFASRADLAVRLDTLRASAEQSGAEICAICTEPFNHTLHLPHRPWCSNGHRFHDACIHRVRDSTSRPCPLCRASLPEL